MEYDYDDCNDYDQLLCSLLNICTDIFTIFTNLLTLVMRESSYRNCLRLCLYDDHPSFSSFRSSTLRILNIRLQSFDNCLYVLDGRFNQLHTLIVELTHVYYPEVIINQVRFTKPNSYDEIRKENFFFLG
jgi:hypothetical protein